MFTTGNSDSLIIVISCYGPTNASAETDNITFQNEIYNLARHIPEYKDLIIDGGLNAQIGKEKNNQFCKLNLPNRNGEYLLNFSLQSYLACLNYI